MTADHEFQIRTLESKMDRVCQHLLTYARGPARRITGNNRDCRTCPRLGSWLWMLMRNMAFLALGSRHAAITRFPRNRPPALGSALCQGGVAL